jgi:hypothetical protein
MSDYTATIVNDLVLTTPTAGSCPPKELDNAIREIKTVMKNMRSIPTTVTTTATIAVTTELVILSHATTAFTVTLPACSACATAPYGKRIIFLNINIAPVTIARAGSDTIDGATSYVLAGQYNSVTLWTNGTSWYTVSDKRQRKITAVSGTTYNLLHSDDVVICSNTSGCVIQPLADALYTGRVFTLKTTGNSGTADITFDPWTVTNDTIDGAHTYTVSDPYGAVTIINDGSGWYSLGKFT